MHGYQKITVGDGATLKTEIHIQRKNHGIHVPMSSEVASRISWFDNDNFSKCFIEGAVSNLLCQLLSNYDAAKFKHIAICNGEQLITAMNVQTISKIVISKTGQINAVEKCIGFWKNVPTVEDHCI